MEQGKIVRSHCGKANRGCKITDAITGPPEVLAFFYKELHSSSANWTLLVIILQLTHSKRQECSLVRCLRYQQK